MLTNTYDYYECMAITLRSLRIAFVSPFAVYSPLSGEFAANIFIRHSVRLALSDQIKDDRRELQDTYCMYNSRSRDRARNRTLKVIGGIVGISQNEKALDKSFLVIAQELSKLLHAFAEEYGSDYTDKITQHHKITGWKLRRMMMNARKLTDVFIP